jgi:Na+/H+ antiporter NhaD/arsenite permease-like protein
MPIGRTTAACAGALLMVAIGAIGPRDALRAIDLHTLGLLFAMMLLAAPLRLTGAFDRLVRAMNARFAHPAALLGALVAAAGILSAVVVNDTVCVVFTPMVLELARARRHSPLPYLLALATAANIGSVATIVGNPQNMLIGSVSRLGFARFTTALAPVAAAGLVIDAVVIWLVFRRELRAADRMTMSLSPEPRERVTPLRIASAIDWRLLLLFAALFVLVGAAEQVGIDRGLFEILRPLGTATAGGLAVTAAALSNVVSNVPAVMLFVPLVPRLPDPPRAWLILAMASTLAGNLTIVGSIANLIVVESARRHGARVRLGDYLKVGVPVTILTIVFGLWWLAG